MIKNFTVKRLLARAVPAFLAAIISLAPLTAAANTANVTDPYVFVDPAAGTYTGRREAVQLIGNLSFTDMPEDMASRDAIVRSGVLNLIKGDAPLFRPTAPLQKQEAIAFAIRAAGMETDALALGIDTLEDLPPNTTLSDAWAFGHLALARDIGLITAEQFDQALLPPEFEAFDEEEVFVRTDPATREEFADWLYRALINAAPNAFPVTEPFTQQALFGFGDWNSISPERAEAVEVLARHNVMTGAYFRPASNITRLEAAMAGRALDRIFFDIAGLERRTGTVGGMVDAQALATGVGELWREIRVRNQDGLIDVLRFSQAVTPSPQDGTLDAVVLRDGTVGGLGTLQVGDSIEYIVHPDSGTVFYVLVAGGGVARQVMARLQLIDPATGAATFLDEEGRSHTFPLAQGMLVFEDGEYNLRMHTWRFPVSQLPHGSLFSIDLVNNVIARMEFLGEMVIRPETWGIVIENNPMLGFITIFDSEGSMRTFNYNPGNIEVQKTEHYDMRDTIGGIHALFPDMRFNPRAAAMDAIEPGNVVSFRTDPLDPTTIIAISASTNYTTRYGRLLEFNRDGAVHHLHMEFDNGRSAWFTMPENIMLRQGGRVINPAQVQPGDWARILINQAIIAPGHVMESVRAMDIDVGGHHISDIVRGRITNFNNVQNQMQLQNAESLGGHGWTGHQPLAQLNIANPQIQFFHNGQPVSAGFANANLRFADAEVYVAMENHHGGERARIVSFRSGRDQLLAPDTVMGTDGTGGFNIISNNGTIRTDPGTIVRRNGRLVDGRNILPWDYAQVALTGENHAAVVDIAPAPAHSGVMIARGRIQSVDQGRSFRVQSMSGFDGHRWHFTPIQREFAIDHDTLFMTGGGLTNINDFIDYTSASVVDDVFNIVIDGSRAARVLDAPYATRAVRGTVYEIGGGNVSLRDMHVHDPNTGRWRLLSNIDATGSVTVPGNSVIIDRNQVVPLTNLRVGDQLRVMTTNADIPDNPTTGLSVSGYIVIVER